MIALRTPAFWYRAPGVAAALLSPLSWVWLAAAAMRRALAHPYTSSIPVICVGNVAMGGAGKTPTAIALLEASGASNPCFLTRGYRGATRQPILITEANASVHGDEAVLLARHAPVIVAAKRADGLKLAEQRGFDLVIADDGFQNPHFTKTSSVLVFDGAIGVGNGACFPAGPLREKLDSALRRAQAAIIVGHDATHLRDALRGIRVFNARLTATMQGHGRYVAFAGIGRPQKFFDTLSDAGFSIADRVSFPDHYRYTAQDIDALNALAQRYNARLITTEKDRVRLPASADIDTLPVQMEIEDMPGLLAVLGGA